MSRLVAAYPSQLVVRPGDNISFHAHANRQGEHGRLIACSGVGGSLRGSRGDGQAVRISSWLRPLAIPRRDTPKGPFKADTRANPTLFATGGHDNDVARITGNVLGRFRSPEPFVWPEAGR